MVGSSVILQAEFPFKERQRPDVLSSGAAWMHGNHPHLRKRPKHGNPTQINKRSRLFVCDGHSRQRLRNLSRLPIAADSGQRSGARLNLDDEFKNHDPKRRTRRKSIMPASIFRTAGIESLRRKHDRNRNFPPGSGFFRGRFQGLSRKRGFRLRSFP